MLRNIIGPLFNFKNCVFFCCFFGLVFQKSSSFCRENEIFENKKHKENKNLDHFLTLKRAKIGPAFNFTAYIYIYIYIALLSVLCVRARQRHPRASTRSHPECTTASQPQSLAISWIAGEIARKFRSEKQIRPFFIAKCIATATVSPLQRNRNLFPWKSRCVQFDRAKESHASTANHRRETVRLGPTWTFYREWPRHCRKEYWTKMDQNGPKDHFGQNDLIPNWILAFARPKWTKMAHFGPFWPEEVHFGPPTVLWPFLILWC